MGGHGHGVREERTHHGARIRIGAIEDPFCLIRKCKRRGGEKRSIHHLLGDAIAVGRGHRVRMMHIRGYVGIIITQQKKGEGDSGVCHANPPHTSPRPRCDTGLGTVHAVGRQQRKDKHKHKHKIRVSCSRVGL